MAYDFEHITGPKSSKPRNFEELMAELLGSEIGAIPIDGSGGDQGVDCFVRDSGGHLTVFQCKYFIGRMTPSRRRQVQKSLERVCAEKDVATWVLCVPFNPTPAELKWLQTLSHGAPALQWWGETKIRTLLAKHPSIAKRYFAQEAMVSEFRRVREELARLVAALEGTPWGIGTSSTEQGMVILYLNRACDMAALLAQDVEIVHDPRSSFVVVDFSEIFSYLTSEPLVAAATPVVDYCFRRFPGPLYMLPPTLAELHNFVRYVSAVGQRILSRKSHEAQTRLVDTFVRAFETDPESDETRQAFHEIMSEMEVRAISETFSLPKLLDLVESGRIQQASVDVAVQEESNRWVSEMSATFDSVRPMHRNRVTQYVDACNLALLRTLRTSGDRVVRMISSGQSFRRAAHVVFGDESPVRTSCEVAYLMHMHATFAPTGSSIALQIRLAEMRSHARHLAEVVAREDSSNSEHQGEGPWLTGIRAFMDFSPDYTDLLRPVDTMIVRASRSLPRVQMMRMQELYEFIAGEANIVDGFRSWWEKIFAMLSTVDTLLGGKEAARRFQQQAEGIDT